MRAGETNLKEKRLSLRFSSDPPGSQVPNKKIRMKSFINRVKLTCKDALVLPYPDNMFDAVFLSFTLELFDTHEIPEVLKEIKRVLKPKGRLGVISLCKDDKRSLFLRLYSPHLPHSTAPVVRS